MALLFRSLDGIERCLSGDEMQWRDLASKVNSEGSKVIGRISRDGLINVSKWLSHLHQEPWEVGVAQDFKTEKLRLVLGDKSKDVRVAAGVPGHRLRKDEYIIVHVHPVYRSERDHFNKDRVPGIRFLEGVLDWSNCLIIYDGANLYNAYASGQAGRLASADSMAKVKGIPFMSGNDIVGYSYFDKETRQPIFQHPFPK